MSRLTEYRKDLKRYEYKEDEKGYCWISEGQIVQKLGQLEDIEEKLDCPLEEIFEFVKLLKKILLCRYYWAITSKKCLG